MSTAVRQPAVAGRFYPANAQRLRAEVETYTAGPRRRSSPKPKFARWAAWCLMPDTCTPDTWPAQSIAGCNCRGAT